MFPCFSNKIFVHFFTSIDLILSFIVLYTVLSFYFLRTMVSENWKLFLQFSLQQWHFRLPGCLVRPSRVALSFLLVGSLLC